MPFRPPTILTDPRGFGFIQYLGDPCQISLAGFQKLLPSFCAKSYRMCSRASPRNVCYYDKQRKRGGGKKRQWKSALLLITRNPLITNITINYMCIMTSTIECFVFLAHVSARNNVLLLQELEWVALEGEIRASPSHTCARRDGRHSMKAPLFFMPCYTHYD